MRSNGNCIRSTANDEQQQQSQHNLDDASAHIATGTVSAASAVETVMVII